MDPSFHALRIAVRSLRKRPGVAIMATLALAIGIGANTAAFSVLDAVLLRPLPFPEPDRLVAVWSTPANAQTRWTSAYPDFADWRAQVRSFERLAAYTTDRSVLTDDRGPTPLVGTVASADLFPLLGVQPELGRTFTEEEDRVGAPPVAVLGHDAWVRDFRSDPAIVGSAISLGGRSVTVVGVMPAGFTFPVSRSSIDYYMPLVPARADKVALRSDMFLRAVARLAPGASADAARSELAGVAARLSSAYEGNANRSAWLVGLHEDLVGSVRPSIALLVAAVALVLLVACANVANLLLAAGTSRRREMALRSALGAARRRLVAQLLVESALLVAAGATLGLLLAAWLLDLLVSLRPPGLPPLDGVGLDARVLLFTLASSTVVTLVAGLAPALQTSRSDLTQTLREGGRGSSDGRSVNRMRSALVVAQVGLSVVLLVAAGLLVRSIGRLRQVDPGFDANDVLTATLAPSPARFATADGRNAYFHRVLENVAATQGVEAAACIAPIPFGGGESDSTFTVVGGAPVSPGDEPIANYRVASADYFRVMRVPVLAGRALTASDDVLAPHVVVVNDAFVRRYFPDEDPVGRSLVIGADPRDNPNPPPRQIVGVVGDTRHTSLDIPPAPEMYVPMEQESWPTMDFVVRHQPRTGAVASAAMRDAMRGVDASEYVAEPRALTTLVDGSVARRELTTTLLGAFACVALLLSTIGIYGVMSYLVARRRHEIGIRMALGASATRVVRHVVGHALWLAGIGAVVGVGGALAASRSMEGMLFGIGTTDWASFAVGVLAPLAVAVISSVVPARAAVRIDPTEALRSE